jgi:hypothetical protein
MLVIFLSGACLTPLAGWLDTPRWLRLAGGGAVLILAVLFSPNIGGFPWAGAILLGLWIATSLVFLVRMGLDAGRWVWPRDAFIALWILGFVCMMLMVMDWVAVRYYHIVTPALGLYVVRIFERRFGRYAQRALAVFTAAVVAFTALLGYADYRQADPGRRIGPLLEARGITGGDRHFYLGDSFTVSYLRELGWVPAFPDTEFRPGDLVLSKDVTMPLVWFLRRGLPLREVETFDFPTRFPIKVMDFRGSAGFYASVWGALPFTFSLSPWERFRLYEVVGDNGDGEWRGDR